MFSSRFLALCFLNEFGPPTKLCRIDVTRLMDPRLRGGHRVERFRPIRQLEAVKPFFVYILASKRNGTLYTGSTDDLTKRVWEHKEKVREGFTSKHGVDRLVWYEAHDTREAALRRERQIKKWNRAWKLRLVNEMNPDWKDLFETLMH